MKRRIVEIIAACLIVVLALSLMKPLHAAASPGNVIISGQVTYQPRDWDAQHPNWRTGNEMTIKLYEKDLQGNNHYLDTTYTNSIGWFVFPERTNWWGPDNRQLNIYLVAVTAYSNSSVTDRLSIQYGFMSETTFLSHDGTWIKNFAVDQNWQGYQAIWIFEDLRNTWNYVHNNDFRNGVPYNPGNVTAMWEGGLTCYPWLIPGYPFLCNSSFAYGGPALPHFIFIADNNLNSMDTVVHETGHIFMVNANGWWYVNQNCFSHYMFTAIDTGCAWSEGWADFLPLAVNGDPCYNFLSKPCDGIIDQQYYNLEVHSRADNPSSFSWGDTVEGRVAAALYDLFDSNNEGGDTRSAGFDPISNIALGSTQITTFQGFWNNWIGSGQDPSRSGMTLWWNTINYINIYQVLLPVVLK
jgi:hypothetical protein